MGEFTCPHSDCSDSDKVFDSERAMKIHYGTEHDGSLAKETAKCSVDGCKNEFTYYPSNKEGKMCESCTEENNHHLTEDKIQYHTIICANCSDEKDITDSRFRNYDLHFCDEDCRDEYMSNREDIVCDNCQKQKSLPYWRVEHMDDNIFCSRDCYLEYIEPDEFTNDWYGSSFNEVRSEVRERDDYKCQICGKDKDELGENPSAHHITPVRWFFEHEGFTVDDANYTENMVLLCRHHHTLVEYDKINLKQEIPDRIRNELDFSKPKADSSS